MRPDEHEEDHLVAGGENVEAEQLFLINGQYLEDAHVVDVADEQVEKEKAEDAEKVTPAAHFVGGRRRFGLGRLTELANYRHLNLTEKLPVRLLGKRR